MPSASRERKRRRRAALTVAVVAVCANAVVALPHPVPWAGPVAGCVLLFGLPVPLLYTKLAWRWADAGERIGYALAITLLGLMGAGLAINAALPHLGVGRPLERLPLLAILDALILALCLWRPSRWPRPVALPLRAPADRDKLVLALCGAIVVAAVAGAVRLNNGAGGGVTLAMLLAVAVALVALIAWRRSLEPGVVTAAVYLIALALLLMTSLRGWYVTGHDIQREFRVFQLTKANGRWDMSAFGDPYNACLSITVLPTFIARITGIGDAYVYKVVFQAIFAYCPVLVYKLARRYASTGVALLAVVYFISFPTFLNDMPFLDRQEIAFLFVAAALLAMTNARARPLSRQLLAAACLAGVVVSHYSTTYVLGGTLVIAWLLARSAPAALPVVNGLRRRLRLPLLSGRSARTAPAVGLLGIVVLVGASLLWTGAYTHTVNGLGDTLVAVVQTLRGSPAASDRSTDVSYSLFSLGAPSERQVMREHAASVLSETRSNRAAGIYYPQRVLSRYAAPIVAESDLPLTRLGRALARVHLDAASFNAALRSAAARVYQVLLLVGLVAALLVTRRNFRPTVDIYALGWAATIIVAAQVVLPVISVDYGILRAFQQALIIVSPFVALGTVAVLRWAGERWAFRLAAAMVVLLFLSLSGVLPQALGGYPPQLNLNNAGLYYDLYYLHPQEVRAVAWLRDQGVQAGDVQSQTESNHVAFAQLPGFTSPNPRADIWPSLVKRDGYVFLGWEAVQKGQAAISYDGDIVLYRYPVGLLDQQKDLVYSSNGAQVFK